MQQPRAWCTAVGRNLWFLWIPKPASSASLAGSEGNGFMRRIIVTCTVGLSVLGIGGGAVACAQRSSHRDEISGQDEGQAPQ
jgi:hypothetical protein